MVATTLKQREIAIIGYNTDDPMGVPSDTISFVLLAPIGSGTQIFFTDRAWNGTTFAAAGGGDGTFTYTAGADLPAGTIVTITQAQLNAAGINLSDAGETIYVYQGAIDAPATFLYAADIADGNTAFEAGELTNTGLSVANGTATAIAGDNGTFGDRGHNIQLTDLLNSISSPTNWTSNDDSPQNPITGNLLSAPDQYVFTVIAGDAGLLRMSRDGANVATQALHHFQNNPVPATQFNHPNDIVFDTVHGLFFIADSDTGNRRILQGNIADLFNPGVLPTLTVLYTDQTPGTGNGQINGLAIDVDHVNGQQGALYFVNQDDLLRVVYDHDGTSPTNQTPVNLASVPAGQFANELTLDIATGRAWIVSTASATEPVTVPAGTPGAIFDPDTGTWYIVATNITNNEIYQVSNLARSDTNNSGNTVVALDLNGATAGTDLVDEQGLLSSVDIDPTTGHVYFTTIQINNGINGAVGGIYRYNLGTGTVEILYTEGNATDFLFKYIDVDPETGRYYVTNNSFESPGDINGTANNTSSVMFHATSAGAPTVFHANAGNINSGVPWGLIVDNAPTLTGTNLNPGQTETAGNPSPNPAAVTPANAFTAMDVDTDTHSDQLGGAQVRISTGFQTGSGHQDVLTIGGLTSGTFSAGAPGAPQDITFSYNSATGVMTLTGASTFAGYQGALASVQFQANGDNPTNFGANGSRVISYSVTDGLMYSDEVHATVTVTGVNDAPVNTIQGAALGISEDALNVVLSTTGNAISVFDVDADPANQNIVVTLSVTQGTLTILTNVVGGIVAGDITGGANNSNTITITATQNEINATLAATNGLLYNPIADYNGSDTLTIVTNDQGFNGNDAGVSGTGTTEQDSDTRTINIAAVVDIANDPVTVGEDSGTATIDVLGNDSFENAARFISSVTQPQHGIVTIVDGPDADGIMDYVTYTQIADYNGSDSFTYTVTSGGVTETATVNVTLTAVVDIADDTLPLAEDAPTATVDVLGNDSFENAARFISGVTQPLHGIVTIVDGPDADGIMDYVTYTAVADYNGTDSFTYTVTSGGVTETATVNVTISAVADIMGDLVTVDEDSGTTTVDVVGNDNFENAGRFISAVTQGANGGTVAIIDGPDADGIMDYVTYTPALNYNGPDSFTYTVTSGGVTETATVNVTVNARNDAPVNTVGAPVIISEDATSVPLTGMSIADVDVDPANDPITVILEVDHGVLNISETVLNGLTGANITGNGSGSVTIIATLNQINATFGNATGVLYTPTTNYNGSDTLTLTTNDGGYTGADGALEDSDDRAITINAVNDTPVVTAAATGSSTEQVAGTVDATATIADADLDAINGGNGNYSGATLTIANNGGNDANDLFAIGTSGAFTVNGSNLEAGGLVFATFAGGNGTPLVISFTSSGTPATTALVNAVVQSIQYTYTGDNPPVAGIDVAISLNDGAPANAGQGSIAGHPATGTDIIHLSITNTPENANPVILNLDGDTATFTEGDVAAVLLDDSSLPELAASVIDPDLPASFNGGSLTVSITANENAAQDVLGVSTGGTVTLSNGTNVGSVVSVGGLAVGTVTANGTGGNDLVIAFDTADATPANISTLIDALTYFNTGGLDPSTAARTVSVTVTDGLGGSGSANVTVNVVGINQEPTLVATGANPTLTEGGLPADLFGGVTASTIESAQTFASMTLTVTNVTDGASESLTFDGSTVALTNGNSVLTATNGLTVNVTVSGTTATVTFSGAALSAGALQTLVDGLAYGNSSDNPTDGNRVVTITEIVDSGSNAPPNDNTTTLAIASTVNVDPVNDNPANAVPGTQTINEDGSLTLSTANLNAISVSDPDATLLTVTLTVVHGTLTLASTTNLSFGTGDGSGDVTMTFTGTAADINAALGSGLTYTPNGDFNGSDSIAISTTDNGQAGSGGTQTDNDSVTVNVTPINDQPNIPNSPTVTTDEQVAVTLNAAITVSDVDLDARNGGAGDYSGAAFAINRSVSDAEDVFSFNTVGAQFTVNGSNLESGGNVIATLAQAGGILNINFVNNGTVPTTALVNDVLQHLQYTNTSNEPPASVTLIYIIDDGAPGGGQGALGAPFNNIDGGQVTVNINSVNDAPSGADKLITIDEDANQVLTTADFGFSDVDNDIFDSAVVVSVTGGTILVDDGNILTPPVVVTSGTISAADIAAGYVSFQPTNNLNGSGAGAISFQVVDNGGTLNGGQNTDQSANTITFDIDSVNDAPAGTTNTVTGSEDDPYVFTLADFGYSDPADLDDFAGVIFTTVPTTGTLFYDADGPGGAAPVALADGAGPIAAADITAGRVYFVPVTDAYGSPYASFTFQVQDDGGITNGGQDTDQTPNTMTINIAPDNLPPVVDLDGGTGGVNYTTTYVEDAPGVAIGSGVAVSDPDSGLGDMIESAVITLTDRVAGDSLTLTGVLPGGFLSVTNLAAGTITITITGSGTGAQYQALIESILYSTTNQDPTVGGTDLARTITVVVNDGTINSAVATTTVNITALDDAPVAQPDAFTITESGTIVGGNLFADNGSGTDSDPDGPPLAVSSVGGGPGANVGTEFTLDSGATLTVNANGTFDYDPGTIFLPTPTAGSGASNTPSHDSFTYTLAGGNTVTVSITLTGLDTDDTLLGTAGADYLSGGNGNDTYYVENSADQVNELNGGGDDRVIASVNYTLVGGTYVETLEAEAGSAPLVLIGNAFDNAVIGNAGANVVHGGGGAGDVLTGLGGNDTYYTDVATTQIVEVAGGGNDALYTSVSYTLGGNADVETLSTNDYGSTAALNLTGNYLNQTLIGNAGANILHGGGGADVLMGLLGNDIYYVDVAATSVQEAVGGGNDIVYASVSYALAAGQSVDILSTNSLAGTGAINLSGNNLAQTIFGNAGNNIIQGGGGTDMLYGLGGNDTYYVDDGAARVFENAGGGSDSVYASVSYALVADQEIEILSANSYASTSAINLTGNNYANTVIGNAGANVLDGQGGNDTLIGLDGADTYAFTTALGAGNVDNVLGFVHGTDKIALDDAVFVGIGAGGALNANAFHTGAGAHDADDRIIYNSATGQLFFDADGNGAGAAVQFANLSPGLGLTASDFLVI